MNLDMRISKNENGTYHIELFVTTSNGLEPIMNFDVNSINTYTDLHEGVN